MSGAGVGVINRTDVLAAQERIGRRVRRTPVMTVELGHAITIKLELLQHTGSFKPRGMFNRLLNTDIPSAGVVIASGGNAGLAAAYACAQLGVRVEVVVPTSSPEAKVDRIAALGPEVIRAGDHYADALEVSEQRIHDTGALRLHAYDDVDVAAGQGTCAAELSEQAPELDTVFVAVGGGGLIAGFAAWYEGDVAVIGVEPERCPALYSARAAGCPVDVDVSGVAVDSLGARRLGDVPWGVNPWIADALLVSDAQIIRARRWLWNELRLVSEHGGAAALAPLLSGAYVPAENERVGVILCGSNTTFDL